MSDLTVKCPEIAEIKAQLLHGFATVEQFAEATGKSKRTVYELFKRGLPYANFAGTRLIPIESARAWLAAQLVNEQHAPPPAPRPVGRPAKLTRERL